MKKTIGFVLAFILLISIIGTVLAECNHNWYTVSTSTKLVKRHMFKRRMDALVLRFLINIHRNCTKPHRSLYAAKGAVK